MGLDNKEDYVGLEKKEHSYYGRMDSSIHRTFADDMLSSQELTFKEFLVDMAEGLRRHMTECKREIIKEMFRIERNDSGKEFAPQPKEKVKWK